MTDFRELLKTRRSIRDFEDKPVPTELVKEIIMDCTMAPSASNGQPWRFIVIHDRGLMESISSESKKNLLDLIRSTPGHPSRRYEGVLERENFNVFYNAPCLVILVGPKSYIRVQEDLSLAACYFMFAAADRGLGTCWVNLGRDIRDPALLERIGLPDGYEIVAPLILGYPKLIPTPVPRNRDIILKVVD